MKLQLKKTILAIVILASLVLIQTVSAAPIHPMNSGPVRQFGYDNFDDNVTDPSLWAVPKCLHRRVGGQSELPGGAFSSSTTQIRE